MRKPKRLPVEALAPYQWCLPAELQASWGSRVICETTNDEPVTIKDYARINWEALFGNANPVEIEVGFGKGLFLINSAEMHPDVNYFGIEIIRKYQLYATTRIASRGLNNAKTCCGDAKLVLRDFVPPESVRTVHVFFPDPWWKSRHKKRTLFTAEFASLIEAVLKPGGHLHFVTDVADYFAMVTDLLKERNALARLPDPEANAPQHDMDYLTNFERKFRREGRPIYRSRYEKRFP